MHTLNFPVPASWPIQKIINPEDHHLPIRALPRRSADESSTEKLLRLAKVDTVRMLRLLDLWWANSHTGAHELNTQITMMLERHHERLTRMEAHHDQ